MPLAKANLILHPIRMRILMALAGKQMTVQQLAAIMPDVPQATLYRHIKALVEGSILEVAEERQVRGTVEKVYRLPDNAAILTADDLRKFAPEDHMRVFVMYMASLLGDFARYLQQPGADPVADRMSYSKTPIYLSDAELMHINAQLGELFLPFLKNGPGEGRRRRLLATVFIPDVDKPAE